MKSKNPLYLFIGWLALALGPAQAADTLGVSAANATGNVSGRVFNLVTGNYLNNARVTVEGTNLSTFTDDTGDFHLGNVPVGEARITVTFTGLQPKTESVRVSERQVAKINFELLPPGHTAAGGEVVMMDKFTLHEKQMSTQMIALNEQRYAPNIKNVVAADEFGDTGEGNVGEFMKYLPGINVEYSSVLAQGISIRGLGSNSTLVTLDGGDIASATIGSGDGRAVNLDALRLNNMSRIEVTKTPTPDLPANAQGGSVNIISKNGFERKQAQFSFRTYANFNSNNFKDTGLDRRPGVGSGGKGRRPIQPAFDFSYIKPINEKFAFTVSGGSSQRMFNFPNAFTDWDLVSNQLTRTRLLPEIISQRVASGSLGGEWRLSDNSILSASAMYAETSWQGFAPEMSITYGAGATGGADFIYGAPTGVGSGAVTLVDSDTRKKTGQFNLRYRFKDADWRFDASAHYSRNRSDYPDLERGAFASGSLSLSQLIIRGEGIQRSEYNSIPTLLTATTRAGVPVNVLDVAEYTLNNVSSNVRLFTDVQRSVKLDLARDLNLRNPMTLRIGGAVNQQIRDLSRDFQQWNFRPTETAAERVARNYDILAPEYSAIAYNYFPESGRVQHVDLGKIYDLYEQRPDYFVPNEVTNYTNSANFGKRLEETISAAFFRGDIRLFNNRLWAIGGVRYERTNDHGEGPLTDVSAIYARNPDGTFQRNASGGLIVLTTDPLAQAKLRVKPRAAVGERSYHGYYPSLNLNYNFTENVIMRAAYSRTISRPNISSIIPGMSVPDPNSTSKVITVVNTGLRPWTSDGYDLSLESYLLKGGTGSVGVFQKDITGFFGGDIVAATPELLAEYGLDDEYLTYEISTQRNLDKPVRIRGIEFTFRQNLGDILPVLKGVGLYSAATFLDITGPSAASFATFSPRTISGGLSYSRGRFHIRVNANHIGRKKGSSISAPNATTPADTYRWFPARTVLTANFSYRVFKNISIFGTSTRFTTPVLITERYGQGTADHARPFRFQDQGIDFTLGVKGEF